VRRTFHDDLDALRGLLIVMAAHVTSAMRSASRALLDGDRAAATAVVADDAAVDEMRAQAEDKVCELLARQQPVATDLRLVVASLHVVGDLERMGDLAAHIAKIALLRHPARAVPAELTGVIEEMARVAESMAWKVARVLEIQDVSVAAELDRDDDTMDEAHRLLLQRLVEGSSHGVQAAVDAALLSRFYERYADHAVSTAKQVIYLVTGRPGNK